MRLASNDPPAPLAPERGRSRSPCCWRGRRVPAIAQVVGGSIGGIVTDDTGGALPGVTVTVTNRANGTSRC